MKVIGINGSARKEGNTAIIIRTVFEELEKEGIHLQETFFGIGSLKLQNRLQLSIQLEKYSKSINLYFGYFYTYQET